MAESNTVRLARLEEKFDNVIIGQNKIAKLLEGNGKVGFIEQTETRFKNIEISLAEYSGGKKMIGAIAGCSLVTGILVFILGKFF